jgi:hypothetical protein
MVCAVLLRFITAARGAQCVMIPGIPGTPKSCADNWASLEVLPMTVDPKVVEAA